MAIAAKFVFPAAMRIRTLRFSPWTAFAGAVALLAVLPLVVILASLLHPDPETWDHIRQYVLADVVRDTFRLVIGTVVCAGALGVSLAWLTAVCDFPGRKFFAWALILPLAFPAYVMAFIMIGLLDYSGPVQTQLRAMLGRDDIWFPAIRSQAGGGVVFVMSLALYPYVYLLLRNAFQAQGAHIRDAARSLGCGRRRFLFTVSLPMAMPWVLGAVSLVAMETLADFGAVSVFNYGTFTTAIYKNWFDLQSLAAAAQLASFLIIVVFVLLYLRQAAYARQRFYQGGERHAETRIFLPGAWRWLACVYCLGVLTVAFIVPMTQMLIWAAETVATELDARYWAYLRHSLSLALMAAALTCAAALILVYAKRLRDTAVTRGLVSLATIGYAVPGTVLAVGLFIPFAWIERQLPRLGLDLDLALTGSVFALLIGYAVRFMAGAQNPIDSAMTRMPHSLDEAALSLGCSRFAMLRRVHLPMVRHGMFTAFLLIFVEVMKEMPITLMTRPFDWDTLAIRIFDMTSNGDWEKAALPAVVLVLAGVVPVIVLARFSERRTDSLNVRGW